MPALIRKNNQGSSLYENCNQSRELQAVKGWENYARRLVDSSKIEYYVTKGGDEVDFLVQDNVTKKRRLVQVTWDMSDETTFTREMKALREAMAETGIADGLIVTWDDEREIDGVRILPAWKWCSIEER